MRMHKNSIRALVIAIFSLTTVFVFFTVASYAISVDKGCNSSIWTPWYYFGSTDVKLKTHGYAEHLRVWLFDHQIHVHIGGGRAYASAGYDREVADPPLSDDGPREKTFNFYISSTNSPNDLSDLANFKVSATIRAYATETAYTYGYVREGNPGEEGYSVASSCTGQ
ncbi:MAG: hypothetical protein OXP71_05675 [Candidatus Poribacteria bacterium]|nr:hypothetical protein [Candidatus Poribacteria bacterium]